MSTAISALLCPQSIAIVGASPKEGSFGDRLLNSIRSLGFQGEVALVNPRYDRIGEMPCYASIADVPKAVDCAAFASRRWSFGCVCFRGRKGRCTRCGDVWARAWK